MLLRHKIALKNSKPIKLIDLIQQYLGMFKEVATLIFDIAIYLTDVTNEEASLLVEQLKSFQESEKDLIRKCRLSLNLCKLRKILSQNFSDLTVSIEELQSLYFSAIELDGKPEKGERKLADDYIVLINEIFIERGSLNEADRLQLISLNEYALKLSPYNFDIQMSQATHYDAIGMSVSFGQTLQELNLKGVQMESLGYLHVRHTQKHGTFDSIFRPTIMRYLKYDESNTYDLNKLKITSLSEENFDQIENFVEYEQYLKKSYFAHVESSSCLVSSPLNCSQRSRTKARVRTRLGGR